MEKYIITILGPDNTRVALKNSDGVTCLFDKAVANKAVETITNWAASLDPQVHPAVPDLVAHLHFGFGDKVYFMDDLTAEESGDEKEALGVREVMVTEIAVAEANDGTPEVIINGVHVFGWTELGDVKTTKAAAVADLETFVGELDMDDTAAVAAAHERARAFRDTLDNYGMRYTTLLELMEKQTRLTDLERNALLELEGVGHHGILYTPPEILRR